MSKNENVEAAEFALDDFASADTADMTVVVNGKPTGWVWTFAGPGHPQTVAAQNKAARDDLHQQREIRQTQLNGKKVKLPEETPDELRERNIKSIVGRLVGWSPVRIDGSDYAFTQDNALKLLEDRRNVALLLQAIEFIADDKSFTKRSATT